MRPTSAVQLAVRDATCVVVAVPSHGTRDVVRHAVPHISPDTVIVSATKGLEMGTQLRMSEVLEQELGTSRPDHRAFRPELRSRGCSRGSHGCVAGGSVRRGRRGGSTRVSIALLPAVRHGRRDWGRDRRCDEKRHCDSGRYHRVAGAGRQRPLCADYARPCRDLAPRRRRGRPPRHARRLEWAR